MASQKRSKFVRVDRCDHDQSENAAKLILDRPWTVGPLEAILIAGIITLAEPTIGDAKTLGAAGNPSGQQLFKEHCAPCHGLDGTGNGPMAEVLKIAPANLTTISERANGSFPADRIVEVIRYGGNVSGHGTAAMPVWGKVFSDEGGGGKVGGTYSRRAIIELKRYLETIQRK
jgi:mono/diheme cytochrome c family protein